MWHVYIRGECLQILCESTRIIFDDIVPLFIAQEGVFANFFDSYPAHPNPLDRSIGNYTLADLQRQYKKYINKRPKHLLL